MAEPVPHFISRSAGIFDGASMHGKNAPASPLSGFCRHFLIFLFCFMLSGTSWGAECDSFTMRAASMPDMTDRLNAEVNRRLDAAVRHANRMNRMDLSGLEKPSQPERPSLQDHLEILYTEIRSQLAGLLVGQMESFINDLPPDQAVKIPFEESIYRDFQFEDAPTLSMTHNMASLVRMGPYWIGADKFGHFFTEGWTCFSLAYLEKEGGMEAAMLFSEVSESVFYGAMVTGVYSYADIVANFNGMRFWSRLTGDHPDPLFPEKKAEPYLAWTNGEWRIVRAFDFRDYIDPAWDEGVNCNRFRNRPLLDKVRQRLAEISACANGCGCPMSTEVIPALKAKYGIYAGRLLNPDGFDVLPDDLQPQVLLDRYWFEKTGKPMPEWQKRMVVRVEERLFHMQEMEIRQAKQDSLLQGIIRRIREISDARGKG